MASGLAGFDLVPNPGADPAAPWTDGQDAILSDAGAAEAAAAIRSWPGYAETPLLALPGLARGLGLDAIAYKDEGGRFGLGSFKALGGAYAVARLIQRRAAAAGRDATLAEIAAGAAADVAREVTVCCATDGNHGRSVAWGARQFGARAVIFIHAGVSERRRDAIAAYGADVVRTDGNYDDSVRAAAAAARREGWTVVSDTSYPGYMEIPKDVMQGYEVMAAEAFDRLAVRPTHLFLQTGVGGMAAAVAAQAKRRWGAGRPRVVLCDPVDAACWVESFRAGRPTQVAGDLATMMAGLACGEVSLLAWEILKDHADAAMAIPDAAAADMMRRLAEPARHGGGADPAIVAGESAVAGLAGLAAAMSDQRAHALLGLGPDSRALVFGTESDTDPELYQAIIRSDAGSLPI